MSTYVCDQDYIFTRRARSIYVYAQGRDSREHQFVCNFVNLQDLTV